MRNWFVFSEEDDFRDPEGNLFEICRDSLD